MLSTTSFRWTCSPRRLRSRGPRSRCRIGQGVGVGGGWVIRHLDGSAGLTDTLVALGRRGPSGQSPTGSEHAQTRTPQGVSPCRDRRSAPCRDRSSGHEKVLVHLVRCLRAGDPGISRAPPLRGLRLTEAGGKRCSPRAHRRPLHRVPATAHPVVGEVGLPALVRLFGGEPQVRRPGPLPGIRHHGAGAGQDPMDRRPRQHGVVVVLQVPADRVRPDVQPGLGQLLAQSEHQLHRDGRGRARRGLRSA
jgi:hypothetical protein